MGLSVVVDIPRILGERDIRYLFEAVASSRYIAGNDTFGEKAMHTTFEYSTEPEFNACARSLGDNEYLVTMYDCFARFAELFAVMLDAFNLGASLSKIKASMKFTAQTMGDTEFDVEQTIAMVCTKFGFRVTASNRERIRQNAINILMVIIAHELGHICLSHVVGSGRSSLSVSRNDERSADLFAASVIQYGFGGESTASAAVFQMLMLFYASSEGPGKDSTHPEQHERVINMINSFECYLVGRLTPSVARKLI